MNNKKLILFISILSIVLTGCVTTNPVENTVVKFDLITVNPLLVDESIKSPVFTKVKSITVADLSEYMSEYPEDTQRLYKSMIKQLNIRLMEDSSYRVVSSDTFKSKVKLQHFDVDLYTGSDDELQKQLSLVGKAMSVHAVAYLKFDPITPDALNNNMTLQLSLIRTRKPDLLWNQASGLEWQVGTNGLRSTADPELTAIVNKALTPLVNEMLNQQ